MIETMENNYSYLYVKKLLLLSQWTLLLLEKEVFLVDFRSLILFLVFAYWDIKRE